MPLLDFSGAPHGGSHRLLHLGMLLAAGRTGSVFSPTDLREFHLREWVPNTELRSSINERLEQVLYRILKGRTPPSTTPRNRRTSRRRT